MIAGLETAQKLGQAKRGTKSWDKVMIAARRQAEDYARALPVDHGYPPFLLIVDVGNVIEVHPVQDGFKACHGVPIRPTRWMPTVLQSGHGTASEFRITTALGPGRVGADCSAAGTNLNARYRSQLRNCTSNRSASRSFIGRR